MPRRQRGPRHPRLPRDLTLTESRFLCTMSVKEPAFHTHRRLRCSAPSQRPPGGYRRSVPTVMRVRGYRFFFYSNEGSEPPHVHVEHSGMTAKFWLSPVRSGSRSRFSDEELLFLQRFVTQQRDRFEEAWREHFGG